MGGKNFVGPGVGFGECVASAWAPSGARMQSMQAHTQLCPSLAAAFRPPPRRPPTTLCNDLSASNPGVGTGCGFGVGWGFGGGPIGFGGLGAGAWALVLVSVLVGISILASSCSHTLQLLDQLR